MSSYSRELAFAILLSISSIGCAQQQPSSTIVDPRVDTLTLLALDSERQKDLNASFTYYEELYKITSAKEYLDKAITYSFKTKKYKKMKILSTEALENFPKQKEFYTRQYVVSLVALKDYNLALKEAKKLLILMPNAKNYELIANIYYAQEDYKSALKYYESAYAQEQNIETLVKLTNVLYSYLNQKDVALAYLETYLQTKGCEAIVCDKLMQIYQEQGNINGMLSILKKMHTKYKQNPALSKTTLVVENLIVSLLEKKNIKEAIKFLEANSNDTTKLLNLYYRDGQLKKALKLTKELYKKTKDPSLLGKIAMYRFEMAKDKRKVMKNVIANFELALSSGINNASYQNYYGYLLIDFDIDVDKGVKLVEQALKTAPNNLAYLDSLAWGYYKQNKCKKAKEIMSKVILTTGLNDPEIKLHWDKINKCKKK